MCNGTNVVEEQQCHLEITCARKESSLGAFSEPQLLSFVVGKRKAFAQAWE